MPGIDPSGTGSGRRPPNTLTSPADSFVGIHATGPYARVLDNDVTFPGEGPICGDFVGAGTGIVVGGRKSLVVDNRLVLQDGSGFGVCPQDNSPPSGFSIYCQHPTSSAARGNTVLGAGAEISCAIQTQSVPTGNVLY